MTLNDIKKSYTEEKKMSDKTNHFFLYYLYRPISFYYTLFFLRIRFTPLQVTFLTFLLTPLIFFLYKLESEISFYISIFLMINFYILDCVDGNMARYLKKQSRLGEYLDSLSGVFFSFMIYLIIPENIENENLYLKYLSLSTISFSFYIYSRYINNRFSSTNKKLSFGYKSIIKSLPNLFPFILLFNKLFNLSEEIVLFFTLLNFSGMIYVILINYKNIESTIRS